MKPEVSDWRLRLLSFGVAALILAFVLITADPREIWQTLKAVQRGAIGAVILLNLPVLALFTARSLLVLRRMDHTMPLPVLASASVLGNVAGALTPAASGEVLRAGALQRYGALTLQDAIALVAYERLFSVYLLVLSTVACLALSGLSIGLGTAVAILCGAGGLFPWTLARFLVPRLPDPTVISGNGWLFTGLRYLLSMSAQVWALLKDLRLTLCWSSLTLVSFGLVALQFRLLARGAAADLSFLDAWVTFGASGIATIASLLPLGLGIGDGSIAAILHATGIPLDRSTAIAVLVRAAITLPLVLMAGASYVYLSLNGVVAGTQTIKNEMIED